MKLFKQSTPDSKTGITQDTGINSLPRLVLTHSSGACVELYRYGAHVTSWKNARDAELLFMSADSWFERGRPIRGGIPVVFPQFCDDGPLPKHGFARLNEWALTDSGQSPSGEVFATLRLEANSDTLRLWPSRFVLDYTVRLSEALTLHLAVTNAGNLPLPFQADLHTYFQVADIRRTSILGLKGVEFADNLRHGLREQERRQRVTFDRETDRTYIHAPDSLRVHDEGAHRTLGIEKRGMNDIVVWNPWIDKSQRMDDFGDDEYQRMVCVETGHIAAPVVLAAGSRWEGATTLSVVKPSGTTA